MSDIRTRVFMAAAAGVLLCGRVAAQPPDEPVIRPNPTARTRLAAADFVARTAADRATEEALTLFNRVLWDDLTFSSFFEMPSKSFYPLRPLRIPGDVSFENWQVPTLDVEYLVLGNLQVDRTQVVIEAYAVDVKTQSQILGKRYTVPQTDYLRRLAHAFADEVVRSLTGGRSRGVALTQIAYTAAKGTGKELQIMDYDGANVRSITANGGLNKFPDWSADNGALAFVTNLPGTSRWELWLQGLTGAGTRKVIPAPSAYASSPALSPDGSMIAFASRGQGRRDSDVFVSTLDGSRLRNLTSHASIDTSPAWSPLGQQIVFVSDRTGTPQLWVMDADGANVRRLTTEGGHCDSPDWSPDGRYIVYSWQAPERYQHDIYLIDVATAQVRSLTHGRGSKENPHWSPDGRHIVFQSDRTGSKQIWLMSLDGENLRQITANGSNENPAWSEYRSLEAN